MPRFVVHLVATMFYDVPVDADDEDTAYDLATAIMGPDHVDHKSSTLELAGWTATPIERIERHDDSE